MGVMRLGHASIKVKDIDAATKHYEDVVGMKVTHRDERRNVYLKCWDEWDKYSVVLTPSDRAGLNFLAYKVEHESDLDVFARRLKEYGVEVESLPEAAMASCGRALAFKLPSGHEMRLFARKDVLGKDVGDVNPDPWPDDLRGVGAHWLDHCALVCEVSRERGINKVAENSQLFSQALGFRLSEQLVVGPGGAVQAAAFMCCSNKPHDIAFVIGPSAGLHHIAFFLDSWHDILKASDIMAKKRVRIDIPPTRHGITRGETMYFFDPSGNRNETFAGLGYLSQPDMPVITWTEDQLGRAIFYHAGEVPRAFAEVFT